MRVIMTWALLLLVYLVFLNRNPVIE